MIAALGFSVKEAPGPEGKGTILEVDRLIAASPAFTAGIRPGMKIVAVDKTPIRSVLEFQTAVKNYDLDARPALGRHGPRRPVRPSYAHRPPRRPDPRRSPPRPPALTPPPACESSARPALALAEARSASLRLGPASPETRRGRTRARALQQKNVDARGLTWTPGSRDKINEIFTRGWGFRGASQGGWGEEPRIPSRRGRRPGASGAATRGESVTAKTVPSYKK